MSDALKIDTAELHIKLSDDLTSTDAQLTPTRGAFTVNLVTPVKTQNGKLEPDTAELHIKPSDDVTATDAQVALYCRVRHVDAGMRRVLFPDRAGCRRPWWLSEKNWDNRTACHTDYMKWLKDIAETSLEYRKAQITTADRAIDTLCWDVLTRWGQDARTRAILGYGVALLAFAVGIILVLFLIGWNG